MESDFIFLLFLILGINFELKTIPENSEMAIISRKILRKALKNSGKFLEMVWNTRNPNKILGAREKDYRAF